MVVTHAGHVDHLNERRDLHSGLAVTTQHAEWLPAQRPWGGMPSIMGAHREPPPARSVRSGADRRCWPPRGCLTLLSDLR